MENKNTDPYKILSYPLSTEKSIRIMESENKLVFIVDRSSKKPEIKKAVESAFKVKVIGVNTQITPEGKKKAYIKLSQDTPAINIATRLGLM